MSEIFLSSIEGNGQWLDGGSMFGNAPRAVWQKWSKPDDLGRIKLSCRGLLIEFEQRKILCEVGIGSFFEDKLLERFGVFGEKYQILKSLNEIGVNESEITDVILSHLHFDHAGGLLSAPDDGEQKLFFSNATYHVGEGAWKRALQPHFRDRASFIPKLNELLESSGRLNLINGKSSDALPDWVEFFYSQGHTPDQMHTVIKTSQDSIVFCGDLIPGIPWVHLPITMGYDRFPEKLIEEKQNLYDWIENGILFFTHDPKFCGARINKEDHKFQPTEKFDRFNRFSVTL